MNKSISVVVRSKNEEQTIGRTLRLIADQTVEPKEIVVVDNASSDDTKKIAEAFGCRVVNIKDQDFNHAYSCNLGAARTTGEFVVFTNGHAFPISRNWLACGVRHFADRRVAGAYCLPCVDDRASFVERLFEAWKNRVFGPAALRVIERPSILVGLGLMSTSSAILRRDLWEQHPFDEAVSAHGGGEDSEWGFHYLRRGYRIVDDPDFAVYHCHGDNLLRYARRASNYYLTYVLAYNQNRRTYSGSR